MQHVRGILLYEARKGLFQKEIITIHVMKNPLSWQLTIHTVTSLTSQIKRLINNQFRDILVEGEISNFKLYPSGHVYFTLKDDQSIIKAVMFNFYGRYPDDMFRDGVSVICKGRVDVYEKRGEYRLIVDALEVRGVGLLQLKFQMLKEKLLKEGIFDAGKKKTLPLLPQRIGIITSPAGAAIRDMLKIIFQRYPNMSVIIYPVKVQGDDACYEIAKAIEYLNMTREVDVIILGRGGGSLEDLAPFNEEVVARAIFASLIPVVSGVGHEIDFTIADFAADVRAPTPTAAAGIAVPDKRELCDLIDKMREDLIQSMIDILERKRFSLYQYMMELKDRRDFIVSYRMYLDELVNNMFHNLSVYMLNKRQAFQGLVQRLYDLNPDNILKRGYSIAQKVKTKEVIYDNRQVSQGEDISLRLYRGVLGCEVKEIINRET
ncbi:MAG TPA: exodeoxyribonuclease VII large subunit [Syntrophorhabdaceae bacterium]|nr:exodeoxyribonuclease VII large subunit [Syntrophorhabdaceae bacterium]